MTRARDDNDKLRRISIPEEGAEVRTMRGGREGAGRTLKPGPRSFYEPRKRPAKLRSSTHATRSFTRDVWFCYSFRASLRIIPTRGGRSDVSFSMRDSCYRPRTLFVLCIRDGRDTPRGVISISHFSIAGANEVARFMYVHQKYTDQLDISDSHQ